MSFKLEIKKPCGENWEKFKTVDKTTRHCASCQKNVVDFTGYSEKQIINFFRSGPQNVCGRLRNDQLKTYQEQKSSCSKLAAVLAAGALISSSPVTLADSQINHPGNEVVVLEKDEISVNTDSTKSKTGFIEISGVVIFNDDSSTIPGVSVILKSSTIGTVTDAEGKFILFIPRERLKAGADFILVFSYVGLLTEEKTLPVNQSEIQLQVKMHSDIRQLGDIRVIAGGISVNPIKRGWWKIKSLFRRD